MRLLTSRDNPLIKDYIKLSGNKNFRRRSRRCVLEGARLVKDALLSGVSVENAFLTAGLQEKHPEIASLLKDARAEIYEISPVLASAISDTATAQGIFCTAFILDNPLELDKIDICGNYLALEDIQDPGNLGTILRTAEALGFDGLLLSPGCADIYSPKVLRASMGAVFRLPVFEAALPQTLKSLGERGLKTFAAVACGGEDITAQEPGGGVLVAIGNEGAGLTQECVAACSKSVTVRMRGRAESLNAAAAAAIIMWEAVRSGKSGQKTGEGQPFGNS